MSKNRIGFVKQVFLAGTLTCSACSMALAVTPSTNHAASASASDNVGASAIDPVTETASQHQQVLCSDNKFARPLGEVLDEIARHFKVNLRYSGVDTTGCVLPYADSRIRPYSLEESLDNVLRYFDWKVQKRSGKTVKITSYEYMRRTDADGEKLLKYLSAKYNDAASFDKRRQLLKRAFRERLGIDALLDKCVSNTSAVTGVSAATNVSGASAETELSSKGIFHIGKIRVMDGYTAQNFYMETLPGLYTCGTIYAPAGCAKNYAKGRIKTQYPLIICPNGHFADGRYNEAQQLRMGTLARMGAICVDWDLLGWGESEMQVGKDEHETAVAQPLQLMNGWLITNQMLSRGDIDTTRVAVNGGSGGGTACVMLTLLDDRFTAACPVVSFCSHFDGGCPCESGMGTALCGGGTCNAEYAALFAPRPMGIVSDGGDWTHTLPTLEYPFLQRIYGFYGATDKVTNYFFPDDRHDFGPNKRNSVYDFFAKVWALDANKIDESKVTIEPREAMMSFGSADKFPVGAVKSADVFRNLLK